MDNEALESEAVKFLGRDFDQCFSQLRHYDNQTMEIVKFAFTAFTATIGAGLALLKYGEDRHIDYAGSAQAIFAIGLTIGLCLLGMLNLNRAYFVVVARYINSLRNHFLKVAPLGYLNPTEFYSDDRDPRYFNWKSSQAFLVYVMSAANAFLLSTFISTGASQRPPAIIYLICSGIAAFLLQVAGSVAYLLIREGKASSTGKSQQ